MNLILTVSVNFQSSAPTSSEPAWICVDGRRVHEQTSAEDMFEFDFGAVNDAESVVSVMRASGSGVMRNYFHLVFV